MIPFEDIIIFSVAALILVVTPGPNMIYLISRSISQGKKAGLISLIGIICAFAMHTLFVSLGLTALLFAIPYAYAVLKFSGAAYLLYLAFKAVKPGGKSLFPANTELKPDSPLQLFGMGFFTNALNPKAAFFYLSFFPQFIRPEYGSVFGQTLQLGLVQMTISFSINALIVLFAAKMALFFRKKPFWLKIQKCFMASVLTWLAVKMAFAKAK